MAVKTDYYACKVPPGGARKGCGGGATVIEVHKIPAKALARLTREASGGKVPTKARVREVVQEVAKAEGVALSKSDLDALSDMVPAVGSYGKPARLTGAEARAIGRQIVLAHKNGIRLADVARQIQSRYPATPDGTIRGAIWDLAKRFPKEIASTADGLKPKGKGKK